MLDHKRETPNVWRKGHFRVAFCLCFKPSLRAKPFLWKWYRLQIHFHANQTHFYVKCFTRRLVLKQRHVVTRKWPILKLKNETKTHQRKSILQWDPGTPPYGHPIHIATLLLRPLDSGLNKGSVSRSFSYLKNPFNHTVNVVRFLWPSNRIKF